LFISRISPKKNLLFALETIGNLTGSVEFDIFGPIDDQEYWKQCQLQMGLLPCNVTASYRGTLPRESVPTIASQYDFFVLPTLGENFGYVILEALAAGCPVILSDQTPWRDSMPREVGWSLALQDAALWHRVLQECVDMEPHKHAAMSLQARKFVEAWAKVNNYSDQTTQLFNLAVQANHI
jgi:glycosyltransferase involved in cell wall biosynthesis